MRMPSVESRRLKSGRIRYFVRVRDTRRAKYTSVTFDTKPEAERFCREVSAIGALAALDRHFAPGVAVAPTLDDWATHHIEHLTGVTDGTRVGYQRLYGRTWAPLIGATPLDRITPDTVAAAVNKLSARYADKSVANAHGLLAAMLTGAVRRGHLAANPCDETRLPRRTAHEVTEHRYLTHAEFHALQTVIPAHYQPLVMTLAGTGMRWGEAEALTVADVNLANATIRVNKAVKWDASKATREVGPPKTKKSRRTIATPPETMDALEPLLDRPRTARLFTAPRGGELRHRTFYDVWKAACAKAGLEPQPRIHDLRHSHVAWLIAANVSLPVIQARLGHQHITTTIDTYGHLLPDIQRAAAHAASLALTPATVAVAELPAADAAD